MIDDRTRSFINLNAIFGALPQLVAADVEAGGCVSALKKPIRLGVNVKNGPVGVLTFADGQCRFEKGLAQADVWMRCNTPSRFNAVIEGKMPPINLGIILNAKFLTKTFTPLTTILTKYLRATPEDLKDDKFFEVSTRLMFYVIVEALAAIGNYDEIGKVSAARIPDGEIAMEIVGGPAATIIKANGRLTVKKEKSVAPRATMEFADIKTARALFSGEEDAMTFIGNGKLRLSGMFPMLDNINRILGRVALYLA